MVLIVFAYLNYKVHTHKVFVLHMCAVCSWPISKLWGGKTRWQSVHYIDVSEVMCSSQNAKMHQCIEQWALGWFNLLPYLWPLDCHFMHCFFLISSCFLSFAPLSCDTVALYFRFHFVTWACRDYSHSIRVHSLTQHLHSCQRDHVMSVSCDLTAHIN